MEYANNKCANEANSILGFIRRAVGPKSSELFSKLYESLVRPMPYPSTFEKVQRKASKFTLGNIGRDKPYEERVRLFANRKEQSIGAFFNIRF